MTWNTDVHYYSQCGRSPCIFLEKNPSLKGKQTCCKYFIFVLDKMFDFAVGGLHY